MLVDIKNVLISKEKPMVLLVKDWLECLFETIKRVQWNLVHSWQHKKILWFKFIERKIKVKWYLMRSNSRSKTRNQMSMLSMKKCTFITWKYLWNFHSQKFIIFYHFILLIKMKLNSIIALRIVNNMIRIVRPEFT